MENLGTATCPDTTTHLSFRIHHSLLLLLATRPGVRRPGFHLWEGRWPQTGPLTFLGLTFLIWDVKIIFVLPATEHGCELILSIVLWIPWLLSTSTNSLYCMLTMRQVLRRQTVDKTLKTSKQSNKCSVVRTMKKTKSQNGDYRRETFSGWNSQRRPLHEHNIEPQTQMIGRSQP